MYEANHMKRKIRRFFVICIRAMFGAHSPSMWGEQVKFSWIWKYPNYEA